MESASVEKNDRINSDDRKAETPSSSSGEPKEKKRIFFLTRNLAEVYAKQGHISTALEIYRRMHQINPSDHDIEKRIDELQGQLSARRGIKSKEQETST